MTTGPDSAVDVLLVAAHGPHLRGLADALGERFDGTVQGRRVSAKTVGLGPVSAAALTAKRLVALNPRAVVHIGTASAYLDRDGFSPGGLVTPERLLFCDHGVVAGVSAFPGPMITEEQPSFPLVDGLDAAGPSSLQRVTVASPASETMTTAMAAKLRTTGASLENLEAFAVRSACSLAEIPYAAVLAVTEVVGPERHRQRQQYERDATVASAQRVLDWLNTGATGLPDRRS